MPLYHHQSQTAHFWAKKKRIFDTSDPGTGKTLAAVEGYRICADRGRMLVIAPLSILSPSWADDIRNYTDLTCAVAHGTPKKRALAFKSKADIVITNHDGVRFISDNLYLLEGFTHICVDEFTAFKNKGTKRSQYLKNLTREVDYVSLLSGTPNSNKAVDIWFPAYLLDAGKRLGTNYFSFRQSVATPIQVGSNKNAIEWVEKETAQETIADNLKDITIRHVFEECTDIPPHSEHTIYIDMPADVMKAYKKLKYDNYLETENGVIKAQHAGVLTKKLLQLLTGAIYNEEGEVVDCHSHRYQLVMDLIEAREQCVVAFNWRHEREALTRWADKYNFSYAFIDGAVPVKERTKIVNDFQDGRLKVIFAHPQSAGHGLTLTAGTSTIWCSPTYNAEHFKQFNRRIYRNGQKRKTETIMVAARNTAEVRVYEKLNGKIERMDDLLQLFAEFSKVA